MITREFDGLILKTGGQNVRIPIKVTLSFDEEYDPFAVQMMISVPLEPEVVWYFGRELLQRGINNSFGVGHGDVRFRYSGAVNGQENLHVCLRNNTGHADLGMPHHEVVAFLNETTDAALEGISCLDTMIDEAIEEILND